MHLPAYDTLIVAIDNITKWQCRLRTLGLISRSDRVWNNGRPCLRSVLRDHRHGVTSQTPSVSRSPSLTTLKRPFETSFPTVLLCLVANLWHCTALFDF